jgi:hypothetical protein
MNDNSSKSVMQRERMRLGQVRKSFAAGLELQAKGTAVPIEFFGACVDYIRASMDRLHAQDQRIHDILAPHAATAVDRAILDHLNARLAKSRDALNKLVAARDGYRAQGAAGWSAFKAAVDEFMDVYFNVLLKGQHSTLEMQKKVFTDQDWDTVAGVSQDSRLVEASLFAAVKLLAPPGADPDGFKAGPPVA